jgi:hypothetical protein
LYAEDENVPHPFGFGFGWKEVGDEFVFPEPWRTLAYARFSTRKDAEIVMRVVYTALSSPAPR